MPLPHFTSVKNQDSNPYIIIEMNKQKLLSSIMNIYDFTIIDLLNDDKMDLIIEKVKKSKKIKMATYKKTDRDIYKIAEDDRRTILRNEKKLMNAIVNKYNIDTDDFKYDERIESIIRDINIDSIIDKNGSE